MYNNQRPNNGGQSSKQWIPIAAVVPFRKDYTFKGRVIEKSDSRTWSNDKGTGSLFTIVFMDSNGDSMAGKFFTAGHDKFFHMIEVGKVYEFSGGRTQLESRRTATTSEYDVTFDQNSEITEITDDPQIPRYSTKKIAALETVQTEKDINELKDYQVIVHSAKPLQTFQTKAGKTTQRRDLQVIDRGGILVDVTYWGAQAQQYPDEKFNNTPVIIMHAMKINEYNGSRQLQSGFTSTITFDPSDNKAKSLKEWYHAQSGSNFNSLREQMQGGGGNAANAAKKVITKDRFEDWTLDGSDQQFAQWVSDNGLREEDGTYRTHPWLQIDAHVVRVQYTPPGNADVQQQGRAPTKPFYEACPQQTDGGRMCNKKLSHTGMTWTCDKCSREVATPEYRWFVTVVVADEGFQRYLTFFDEHAATLFGKKASEANAMLEEDPSGETLQNFFQTVTHRPLAVLLRPQIEDYNDNKVVRYRVVRFYPKPEYAKSNNLAVKEIEYLRSLNAHVPPKQ